MTTPVVEIPITGKVDGQLLRDLALLNTAMAAQAQHLETAGKKAEDARGGFTSFADSVNEIREAVTSAAGDVMRLVEGVVALADEQQRLDDAAQSLGLDFDAAAEAAGRFTDETDTMRSAQRFAASEIRLTQTELDALARVAGSRSRQLGVSTSEAVNMLTESLIRGREAGLQRFGTALADVAGESHTVGERLDVLVREAQAVGPATDTAADAMSRLKDSFEDMARASASAFVEEIDRVSRFGHEVDNAGLSADRLKAAMTGMAREVASTLVEAVRAVQLMVAALEHGAQRALHPLDAANAGVVSSQRAVEAAYRNLRDTVRGDFLGAPENSGSAAVVNLRYGGVDSTTNPSEPGRNRRGDAGAQTAGGASGARAAAEATKEELAKLAQIADLARVLTQETALRVAEIRRADEAYAAQRETVTQLIAAEQARWLENKRRDAEDTERAARNRDSVRQSMTAARLDAKREEGAATERERAADTTVALRSRMLELANTSGSVADAVTAAYGRMGDAAGAHFTALVTGAETAGEAMQGWVNDTLSALAQVAAKEAMMSLGRGLAALFVNPPAAAAHFASAAAFGVVAVGAGLAAQATAPAAASAGNSAAAMAGGTSRRTAGDRPSSGDTSSAPTVINYYAPVIGGRDATPDDVRARFDRYDDRARRRAA